MPFPLGWRYGNNLPVLVRVVRIATVTSEIPTTDEGPIKENTSQIVFSLLI